MGTDARRGGGEFGGEKSGPSRSRFGVGSARERSRGSSASGRNERGRAAAGVRYTAGKYKDMVMVCSRPARHSAPRTVAHQSSHDRPSPRLNCPRGRQGADPIFPVFGGERARKRIYSYIRPPRWAWTPASPLAHVDCVRVRPSPLRGQPGISRGPRRVGAA